ncbi:MAG: thymidine phosphorylase [Acidobacteria bacterium]|nr:MAG: thymidine phosphorylase [Acidobacteriota bacterium]
MLKLIETKKKGEDLSQADIEYWIEGAVAGRIPDYQSAALLMAIRLMGMTTEEIRYLTMAMLHSGDQLHFDGYSQILDKHSTGGVGDKVTLVLAPLMAACGVPVAMLSGRGLGFTGGTIDKFESIKGVKCSFSREEMQCILNEAGWTNSMPTRDLVPADRLLYALRDVTSTVDSIPLITASIMSKKLAGGATDLCLDVKCGQAAFMRTQHEAQALYRSLKQVGDCCGLKVKGIISRMDEPLGRAVGNYVEVLESVQLLKQHSTLPLMGLIEDLGEVMLSMARPELTSAQARELMERRIEDGSALAAFYRYLRLSGAEDQVISELDQMTYEKLAYSPILAEKSGQVTAISGRAIAESARDLGAGRLKKEDAIDPMAGILLNKVVGQKVNAGEILAWCSSEKLSLETESRIRAAFKVDAGPLNSSAGLATPLTLQLMD